MNQTQRELAYYKALKNAQTGQIRALEAANKKLDEIIKEMEGEEPRFLLDKDSICYGCPEYKRITDCDLTDPWNHWGEGDGNGGVCDTEEPCFAGSRNTYKKEMEEDMLARKCDRCGKYYGRDETAKIRRKKVRVNRMELREANKDETYKEECFDLCPACVYKLVDWLKEGGQNEDL